MEYNSNIIPILTGLGQDPMKFSNVEDYKKGLKRAIADIEANTKGSGDNRSKLLRNEFYRIHKIRKTKIDPKKVFNRGSQAQTDSTKKKNTSDASPVGGSNAIVKYIQNNEEAIGKLTNIVVSDAEDEKKKQKKKKIQTDRENEQKDAKKEEGALEKFKNFGKKALLGPVKAVGKSVKGTLEKLFDFIKLIVGGWFVDKGFKFMEAWEKGDTETMRKIGMNLIAAVAAVGGVIIAMNFGLLALPKLMAMLAASIIKIGAAILTFLVSPAGLIALAIAAGIGTVVAGWHLWKNRDGSTIREERQNTAAELEEAGIKSRKGVGTLGQQKWSVRDGSTVSGWRAIKYEDMNPEQKAAADKFLQTNTRTDDIAKERGTELRETERGIRSQRMKDMPQHLKDSYHKSIKNPDWLTGMPRYSADVRAYLQETNRLVKEERGKIESKYDNMIQNKSSSATINSDINEAAKIDNVIKDNNLSSLTKTKPNVTFVKKGSSTTDNTGQNLREGNTTDVPSISSSDSSNFYTMYSKMNYNVVG